jgi:hypothetical protein
MWKDKHDCAYCAVQFCDARTDDFNMEKDISAVSVPAYKGPDEIDKWLEENFNIGPGRLASMDAFKYHVARAVAEKFWWHSVKDSLPPMDEEVIVLTNEVNGKIIPDARRICYGHIVDKEICYDYDGWNIPGVTHWMHCPTLESEKI